MRLFEFAKYLQKLEETPKRLEITSILSELLGKLEVEEVDKAVYLSLGYLDAPFKSVKFNMADKMVMSSIELAFTQERGAVEKKFNEKGDLGNVAYDFALKESNAKPTILEVYENLIDIAKDEGSGSQGRKISSLAKLLKKVDRLSAKFIVRIVLKTNRLGFTELTIIDALSHNLAGDKSLREKIEEKYNAHPDIGNIANKLMKSGIEGIKGIDVQVGIPLLPQKPQRASGTKEVMERMKQAWAEYKFDGTRVQLHMDRNTPTEKDLSQESLLETENSKFLIKTYTRNLDETTHQFPEIIEAAAKQINAESVILDGEAIGYDKESGEFLPFQETIQRKRKHGVSDLAKQIPLKYIVFDIIYYNGKSLVNDPLTKRRDFLEKIINKGHVIEIDEHLLTHEEKKLFEFLEKAKGQGLEGIMIKNPESMYQAGARSYNWIKLKRLDEKSLDDSLDCVVLGYYFGKGVRSKFGIGGFLVGIYDEKTDDFKTISKVGTGLKDEDWVQLKIMMDKIKTKDKPKNVQVKKELFADVWVEPQLVVVIRADEISKSTQHTAGFALRFPRLMELRTDKKPTDTTSVSEVEKLFSLQTQSS